ncbi:hypothetical protein [Pseudomonas aeruginosa]|uniref:hypothetical protein n=1 Tax=Pseudomonas aeruginosa TaxID=287 RepID=UPI0031B6FA9E
MKKQILTLLTLAFISGIANAGYSFKVPLETSAGGILPNGSINLSSNNGSGSGNGNGSGSENEGEEGSGNQNPPDGQATCDSHAVNTRAMYTFLGMGTVNSHSFTNEECILNITSSSYSSNPEGLTCTNNGDGTATFEQINTGAFNYETQGIKAEIKRITFNGSCIEH